ncbi:MAG: FeoA family protein [Lachnospiraceae bacterium]
MPLTMAKAGEEQRIRRIGGNEDTKKFLETLGFVAGGNVSVVIQMNGNMIVNVKGSRIAISKEMANKIQV